MVKVIFNRQILRNHKIVPIGQVIEVDEGELAALKAIGAVVVENSRKPPADTPDPDYTPPQDDNVPPADTPDEEAQETPSEDTPDEPATLSIAEVAKATKGARKK